MRLGTLNVLSGEVSVIPCDGMNVAGIEEYMREIDRSLFRENLKLMPAQEHRISFRELAHS